jgi:DNA-binding transcriptional MocR family regulator
MIFLLTPCICHHIFQQKGDPNMAAIKETARIADKWERRAGNAQAEYEEGVRNPRKDWAAATASAEKAFEQGIQQSIQRKAFGKGVRKAGTAKWQENAVEKGPVRFAQGVSLAKGSYEEGFAPFRQTISNLTLPARGAKGDPKNINRVAAVAKALHDKKLELEGR